MEMRQSKQLGKITIVLIFFLLASASAQSIQYTCKRFHRPSSSRLEKRQNVERNVCRHYQESINLLNYMLGASNDENNLPNYYKGIGLRVNRIELNGKYQIVFEGDDSNGVFIKAEHNFIISSPFTKEYLSLIEEDPSNMNKTAAIVYNYIEPYYFLKMMEEDLDAQQLWLDLNKIGVEVLVDISSFSRSLGLDLRSPQAANDFLVLKEVFKEIKNSLDNMEGSFHFSRIKIGFDTISCQNQYVESYQYKQLCLNLHDLFWTIYPENRAEKIESFIQAENNYFKRIFGY
ncbi:hypothetical protein MRY82_04025 [bacterium]|nr:hypothetical protein [bacterium]